MPGLGVRGSRLVRTCTNLNPTVLTIAILAVATLLRLLFTPLLGSGYAFITYYPAIIFSTIVGGWKCGLFASVASEALAVLIFIDPIANSEHAAALILFFLLSGLMIASAEVVLRGRHQAQAEASLLLAREEALIDEIAARERAEEALRDSEERFRTLGDHMSQFAWITDQSGDAVWFNRRWYEYTGTTFEEMRGWGWRKVHHPEHEERVVGARHYCPVIRGKKRSHSAALMDSISGF
jgi:PAS domain-containing protein